MSDITLSIWERYWKIKQDLCRDIKFGGNVITVEKHIQFMRYMKMVTTKGLI